MEVFGRLQADVFEVALSRVQRGDLGLQRPDVSIHYRSVDAHLVARGQQRGNLAGLPRRRAVAAAGAELIVAGSAVIRSADYARAIADLEGIARAAA